MSRNLIFVKCAIVLVQLFAFNDGVNSLSMSRFGDLATACLGYSSDDPFKHFSVPTILRSEDSPFTTPRPFDLVAFLAILVQFAEPTSTCFYERCCIVQVLHASLIRSPSRSSLVSSLVKSLSASFGTSDPHSASRTFPNLFRGFGGHLIEMKTKAERLNKGDKQSVERFEEFKNVIEIHSIKFIISSVFLLLWSSKFGSLLDSHVATISLLFDSLLLMAPNTV